MYIGKILDRISPVPVAALAQISLPSKAIGIVLACTGVGLTNPSELTACDNKNIKSTY